MAVPKLYAASPSSLHLVGPSTSQVSTSRSPVDLWHLLSLDAPTVAALWTAFIAWSAGVALLWTEPLAIFTAVWILYAADRLLDARALVGAGKADDLQLRELEERHWFHHRNRSRFLPAVVLATIPLTLVLHLLPSPALHLYTLLAASLCGWLLLVHGQPSPAAGAARRLPKELAVGVFFPAAVWIPTIARAPGLRFVVLPWALLFAGVCTLNCLLLYAWEHGWDRSRAHRTTSFGITHRVSLSAVLCFSCLVCTWPFPALLGDHLGRTAQLPHAIAPPLACLLSTVLLLTLNLQHRRVAALRLRALADLALLTPLVFFAWSAAWSTWMSGRW